MIARAGIRHGVMATLAKREWGLEVNILRSAHATLLTSLMTYGMAATGGTAYEKCLDRLETLVTNINARRITGASRSARLAVLHMVADVTSARNLFLQQSALFIDRAMRIRNCEIRDEIANWTESLYNVRDWTTAWRHPNPEEILIRR